ncbi:hypothetical protein SAMD00023353_1401650 [Rosellinia necatrix]|uniref:DUF952 domain protein n=1 Tax=Rosellinia necatrix TaxID=77044 RepID=A0A1W2TD03_ROSNE|nr:hypothetical protein SAMD00023353_1401650 [Rosellinia necatrix]
MAPPTPLPTYVYKIVPAAPPSPIPVQYPLSELDQKDGFVHLSVATQIPTTAGLFFKESTTLWILKIRFKSDFQPATNWDVPGCPHLYGNFGAADVEGAREFSRSEGEAWADAMARQGGFLV